MRRPPESVTVVVCFAEESDLVLVCERLIEDGYAALPATSAEDALRLCRFAERVDLLVVDLNLPGYTGLELLRDRQRINDLPDVGVLALMDRTEDPKVFRDDPELAVDDYLLRPFTVRDLRSRLETILRRRFGRQDVVFRLGQLVIDPARHKVMVGEREVRLAKKEMILLRHLATDPTRVFSKEELLAAVWGLRRPEGKSRTLDSHVSRLRRKLDPEHHRFVTNCWGQGFRLVDRLEDAGAGPPSEMVVDDDQGRVR